MQATWHHCPLDGGVAAMVWPGVLVRLGLVAPGYPTRDFFACEQFDEGAGATALDQGILLVGFARVFLLAADEDVDLPPPRGLGAQPTPDSEQEQLGDIAEVEADAAAVGAAVLADLQPYEVCFVSEAPLFHHAQTLAEE